MRVKLSHNAGHAQPGIWGVLFVIALIAYGAIGVYTAYKNPKPLVIGIDDYLKQKPSARWLVLTNCTLHIPDASYTYSTVTKDVKSLTVPVHGKNKDGLTHVLFITKNPSLRLTLREILVRAETSPEAALSWIGSNSKAAYPKYEVRGLVDLVNLYKTSENKGEKRFADDVICIEDGGKPSWAISLSVLLTGLFLAAFGFKKPTNDAAPLLMNRDD